MLAPMMRKIKTLAKAVGPCWGSPFMTNSFHYFCAFALSQREREPAAERRVKTLKL